jgi:hypothetical protein
VPPVLRFLALTHGAIGLREVTGKDSA